MEEREWRHGELATSDGMSMAVAPTALLANIRWGALVIAEKKDIWRVEGRRL